MTRGKVMSTAAIMGIVTLLLLIGSVVTGLLMSRNRKVLFKVHRALAIITVVVALVHAVLVIMMYR